MTKAHRTAELAAHPFAITLPIQWGDQDAFGHVNNTVYFRWFESSRVAYLDQLELAPVLAAHQLGPILASIKCDFRRQLKYPDTVIISSSITHIGRTSVKMAHLLYSQTQQAVAAEGDSTIVVFDYGSQRPTPIPADVRAAIAKLEGRSFDA